MSALIAAEWLKLRSVRSTWWIVLVLPLVAVVTLFDAALDPVEHNASLADFMDVSLVVVGIAVAAFSAALVGAEFQRRLIGLDYLAAPKRAPVLVSKMVALAGVAAALGLLAVVIAHLVAAPVASGRGVDAGGGLEILERLALVTLAIALLGVLGAAIGVAVPHPAVAVGAILAWQIAEGVLGVALGISEYLPIRLVTTVAQLGGTVALPVAFGLLGLYAIGIAGLALVRAASRDLA